MGEKIQLKGVILEEKAILTNEVDGRYTKGGNQNEIIGKKGQYFLQRARNSRQKD